MSYQVLARKWRPRAFESLVGQEHVVKALRNALDQKRLHHAYLFSGTRGVGKTTLARILAKCLNCETGISSRPCGKCSACMEIDSGRFVDLIEVDAATNTKVDEMRQLLENSVYVPTRGRFKVYVIDEVHMLSTSAFNAMLKTLEEPPEHIKFILATTDPQKIPVTVLSRCLQFNLKQMPSPAIAAHLEAILGEEKIPAEAGALRLLAEGARGSMRDALSLLDQAIAYGAGNVTEQAVRAMLGTIDDGSTMALLRMRAFAPGTRGAGEPQRSGSARGEPPQAAVPAGDRQPAARGPFDGDWPKLANSLNLGGVAKQLAQASELGSFDGEALELYLPPAAKHLAEKSFQDKLRGALQERFGKPMRMTVTIRETTGNSARDRAAAAVTRDAFVRDLVENFDATIVESSIKPTQ